MGCDESGGCVDCSSTLTCFWDLFCCSDVVISWGCGGGCWTCGVLVDSMQGCCWRVGSGGIGCCWLGLSGGVSLDGSSCG